MRGSRGIKANGLEGRERWYRSVSLSRVWRVTSSFATFTSIPAYIFHIFFFFFLSSFFLLYSILRPPCRAISPSQSWLSPFRRARASSSLCMSVLCTILIGPVRYNRDVCIHTCACVSNTLPNKTSVYYSRSRYTDIGHTRVVRKYRNIERRRREYTVSIHSW